MNRRFDEMGYPTNPHATSELDFWFYVQKTGIVVAFRRGTTTISWQQIKRALKDHEAASKRRK